MNAGQRATSNGLNFESCLQQSKAIHGEWI